MYRLFITALAMSVTLLSCVDNEELERIREKHGLTSKLGNWTEADLKSCEDEITKLFRFESGSSKPSFKKFVTCQCEASQDEFESWGAFKKAAKDKTFKRSNEFDAANLECIEAFKDDKLIELLSD